MKEGTAMTETVTPAPLNAVKTARFVRQVMRVLSLRDPLFKRRHYQKTAGQQNKFRTFSYHQVAKEIQPETYNRQNHRYQ